MANTPTTYTKEALAVRIGSLVDELRTQCEHLDRLSVEQGVCLSNGEVEAVLDVLRRREPVLVAMGKAGDQVTAILENKQCIEMLGLRRFTQVRGDLLELEKLADTIRRRDAGHHEQMQRQRDGLSKQLASVGQKKTAMDAYSMSKGTPNPTLHDRRG